MAIKYDVLSCATNLYDIICMEISKVILGCVWMLKFYASELELVLIFKSYANGFNSKP